MTTLADELTQVAGRCSGVEMEDLLLRAAARIREMEWQPIETAPRDGQMFLVCFPRVMGLICRARYSVVYKYFQTDMRTEGLTTPTFFHKNAEYGDDMWMPLPQPPAPRDE